MSLSLQQYSLYMILESELYSTSVRETFSSWNWCVKNNVLHEAPLNSKFCVYQNNSITDWLVSSILKILCFSYKLVFLLCTNINSIVFVDI